MSRSAAIERQLTWKEVLGAADRREGERSFLMRLLQFFCQQYELKAAALYTQVDSGYERLVSAGAEAFPASIADDKSHPFDAVVIPGGLLLFAPGATPKPDFEGPLVLALAAGLRSAVLHQRLKQKSFAINYRGVELEALYDVGLAIASTLNLDQLGEEILLRAVSLLDARRGALYLRSENRYLLDHTLGGDALDELQLDESQIGALLEEGLSAATELLPGAQHLMAVPIGADGSPRGLLIVADKERRHGVGPFPKSDRRTLSLFANQAAIALETAYLHRQLLEKERLERELQLAADIQRRLLPKTFPRIEGFELAGWSRPARHVGGDYYDLLRLGDGRIAAVLADVSGKGMPAALMVSTIHSAVRLLAAQVEIGPDFIRRLNHHIAESSAPNKFITLLLAELDPVACDVRFVNAGHNPGLLLRPGGEIVELESGGLPVGVFDNSSWEAGAVRLEPGDLLCLYSDGITECASPADEQFGNERLIDLLRQSRNLELSEIVAIVDHAVTNFAAGLSQGDDQTLVLLRRAS